MFFAGDNVVREFTTAVIVAVSRGTPLITWANPADTTYGTALGTAQLDATASVPGTFAYMPPRGTVLGAGESLTLTAIFTPTDSTDYTGATATANINVEQAAPELGVNPVNLTYGTPLANGQLTGSATWTVGGNVVAVPGSWSYTSSAGTVLDAGNDQSELVTFTPTDSVDYTSTTATVTVNMSQAAPDVGVNPLNLLYATPLANSQLTGTATWMVGGNVVTVAGSWSYTSAAGVVLSAGADQGESVTFTPTDSVDYTSVTAVATVNVSQAIPEVTVDPVNLTYGTPLANGQLIGTATWTVGGNVVAVPGSWSYTRGVGTLLKAGSDQSESVTFTPTDSTDYTTAMANVMINVSKAMLVISADNETKTYGSVFFSQTAFTTSGLVGGDAVTSVTLTSNGAAATAHVLGSPYAIIPGDAVGTGLGNYSIMYQDGALTLTPYSFRYTIASDHQTYGTPANLAADLGTTISTGVNGQNLDIAYSSAGDSSTTNIGSYDITGMLSSGTGELADYDLTLTPGTLTVIPAKPTISLKSSLISAVYGQSVTFTAVVSGALIPTGSVTFSADGTTLETVNLDSTGEGTFTTSSLSIGVHAIVATYNGSANFIGVNSGIATESIDQDGTQITFVTQPTSKRRKLVSLRLVAEIQAMAPGAGVPTGTVIFELLTKKKNKIQTKAVGTTTVVVGVAAVKIKPSLVLGQAITVVYSGDAEFLASKSTSPKVSRKGLV